MTSALCTEDKIYTQVFGTDVFAGMLEEHAVKITWSCLNNNRKTVVKETLLESQKTDLQNFKNKPRQPQVHKFL